MEEMIKRVLEGGQDALEAYVELKRSEKEIADAIKKIKPLAIDEADNYPDKTFKAFGATISKKSGGGRWDYKHLEWWDKYKELESGAKEAAKSKHQVVTEDGEIVLPARFIPNKDTINIEF